MSYAVVGGVATITMDHEENRNALTATLLEELHRGIRDATHDASVRVIVLTNTGPAFCAGADLKGGGGDRSGRFPAVLAMLTDSPKPVVGRIDGHCLGGGVGLAAACDLSIAAAPAQFGFTEVRIGVAPAIISVVVLAKVRRSDALELFLTGERISAERAAQVGLITKAVAQDRLDDEVGATVAKLMAGGPGALTSAKELIAVVPGMARDEAYEWAAERSASLFRSEEAAEGMAAFRERRRPGWAPDPGPER